MGRIHFAYRTTLLAGMVAPSKENSVPAANVGDVYHPANVEPSGTPASFALGSAPSPSMDVPYLMGALVLTAPSLLNVMVYDLRSK